MKFGLIYELQMQKPWGENQEHKTYHDALDQIELADQVGFDYVWEVEHHFLTEYSHSSAPEVFLGAASQRTKNIRIGQGVVVAGPVQPPNTSSRTSSGAGHRLERAVRSRDGALHH